MFNQKRREESNPLSHISEPIVAIEGKDLIVFGCRTQPLRKLTNFGVDVACGTNGLARVPKADVFGRLGPTISRFACSQRTVARLLEVLTEPFPWNRVMLRERRRVFQYLCFRDAEFKLL